MASKKRLFSVIIPAFNEEKYISDCLKSVLNQNIPKSNYEVIVVDNASSDNTANVAKKFPVKIMFEPQKGNVFARIKGVSNSKSDIIVFTDADCRVPPNWLEKFEVSFTNDPKLDATGGVFEYYDGNSISTWLAKHGKKMTYHVSGGNMAIRRKSLERLGGLDPKIIVGEDTILHFKLKKDGKELIDQSQIVQTSARRMNKNLVKTLLIWAINDTWLRLFGKAFFKSFGDVR